MAEKRGMFLWFFLEFPTVGIPETSLKDFPLFVSHDCSKAFSTKRGCYQSAQHSYLLKAILGYPFSKAFLGMSIVKGLFRVCLSFFKALDCQVLLEG